MPNIILEKQHRLIQRLYIICNYILRSKNYIPKIIQKNYLPKKLYTSKIIFFLSFSTFFLRHNLRIFHCLFLPRLLQGYPSEVLELKRIS